MVIKSQIAKIEIFLLVNVALLIILYSIPIKDNNFLENLCIYKLISKKECFNCGMTRAFIHGINLYGRKNKIWVVMTQPIISIGGNS